RGNQACRGQITFTRKRRSLRRWFTSVISVVSGFVSWFQTTLLHIAQNFRPHLDALADRDGISMGRNFLGARLHMQSAQNNFAALLAIPLRQRVSSIRESQMHSNSDQLRQRCRGGRPLKQIFVPVLDSPILRSRSGDRCQRQRWGQHVLAKTAMWRLRIERIEQQGIPFFYGTIW